MSATIQSEVHSRGITRLCHFTPARNLVHIASHRDGIKASGELLADQTACFTATDTKRIDGYTGHICCSIEYPNAWYLSKVEANDLLFKDWVIIFAAPHYLWDSSTRFCPRNAAADWGGHIASGLSGFQSLFVSSVVGAYGKTNTRSQKHLSCSPTDDQAEVLVQSRISLSDVIGIAVKDESQAKNEITRLRLAGVEGNPFRFFIVPEIFKKYSLSNSIRAGKRPTEVLYSVQE